MCLDDPENIEWDPCSIADRTIDESKTRKALKASFTMPENDFTESNEPPQMTNYAPEDTTSKVNKEALFGKKAQMGVEVSQERGLAQEIQSKIDYQRWLSFAKSNRTLVFTFERENIKLIYPSNPRSSVVENDVNLSTHSHSLNTYLA